MKKEYIQPIIDLITLGDIDIITGSVIFNIEGVFDDVNPDVWNW